MRSIEAQKMAGARCACGFSEVAGVDGAIGDHLREVFTPDDDTGPDGTVHLEGETGLFCVGGSGGSAERLDSHFLEAFTPVDSGGRDGVTHRPVG
jgi:hypothetical protein